MGDKMGGINQPEPKMNDSSLSLSNENQQRPLDEDEWPCFKYFCKRCFTSFPNQDKLDEHPEESCNTSRERSYYKEISHYEEGNYILYIRSNFYKHKRFSSLLNYFLLCFLGELMDI